MDTCTTIFVVEPDPALRSEIMLALADLDCLVRDFADANDALAYCTPEAQGCWILGDQLHGISGLHLHQKLLGIGCCQPFIIISAHGVVAAAVEAMLEGALDYIEQPICKQRLMSRVQQAIAADLRQRRRDVERLAIEARLESLTARQLEILRLVASGRLTKEIARSLMLSPKTVEVHRSHIMKKMHVDSTAELHFLLAKHWVNSRDESASSEPEKTADEANSRLKFALMK